MAFVRVVDMETTGADPASADVIEVGWVDVDAGGRIGEPVSLFARPQRSIELEAMAVHHLTEADVASGVAPDEWQAALLADGPAAFVAHNAKFEAACWPDPSTRWICTYKSALRLWPDAPRHTNQVLRYWLNLDADPSFVGSKAMPPHRAAPDAYVTAFIFARMLAGEGDARLRRMLAWTKEPSLMPKVLFGKHRGSKWSDVPTDYLQWIERQSDMDEDVVFTADQEMQRRLSAQATAA